METTLNPMPIPQTLNLMSSPPPPQQQQQDNGLEGVACDPGQEIFERYRYVRLLDVDGLLVDLRFRVRVGP